MITDWAPLLRALADAAVLLAVLALAYVVRE